MKNQLAKKENEINSLKHEVEEMNQNLTEAFSRLDEKENDLVTQDVEKQVVQKERDELRLTADGLKHENLSTQKALEQRNTEIERLSRELQFMTDKKNGLEKELGSSQEKNRDLLKRKTELMSDLDEVKRLHAGVNQELNRYKGETQCLEGLKQNLERERDRAIGEYVDSRNKADGLRREKEKLIEENKSLKVELATVKELLNELRKTNRSLEEKKAELARALKQYELNGEDVIEESKRLKNENQILQTKLAKLENETLNEVTEKYTESIKLRAEMDALRNELRKRNKLFESQSSTASDYDSTMESAHKKEIVLLKMQLDKLTEDEGRVKAELNTTKNKFQVYMKDRSRIENELREKSQELEREKSNVQTLEREKSLLQARVDRLKSSSSKRAESAASDHKNKVSYLEQQIKALKTTHALEIEAKKVENDSLSRQIELLSSVERSRKFLDPTGTTADENNNKEKEAEIQAMKNQFRLRSQIYEKEIEFINLKYSLVVAENEENSSGEEIKKILHDMSMVEREKQHLKLEWQELFPSDPV